MKSKIPTDVYILSVIGVSVTPEICITRKKVIWNHHKFRPQESIQFQIKIPPELSPNKIQTFHQFYELAYWIETICAWYTFSNKTQDEHNDSTDNSRTENEISVNKLNVKQYEDKDDEYK